MLATFSSHSSCPRRRGRYDAGCAGAIRMARQSARRPSRRDGIHADLDEHRLALPGQKEGGSWPVFGAVRSRETGVEARNKNILGEPPNLELCGLGCAREDSINAGGLPGSPSKQEDGAGKTV